MIYLDHAAATPVSQKALAAMLPYFSDQFFNPSSPYLPAKHVKTAYLAAKDAIAHTIGAKGTDLIITAGATESINLAFTAIRPSGRALVLATEHAAVLGAASSHSPTLVKVDRTGLIDLSDFRAQLTPDIELVSVSLANNELGTIQPLADLATIIRAEREERLAKNNPTPLYFHTDASQAANLLDINVARLGVDLLTLNAAKCGGPKGVGALYLAHGVPIQPINRGGGQERGLRSGTENVPGVIGFAAAITEAKNHLVSSRKTYLAIKKALQEELAYPSIIAHIEQKVKTMTPETVKNRSQSTLETPNTPENHLMSALSTPPEPLFLGHPKHQLANFLPVSFPSFDAERLIFKLERQEIYLSTGAACAANKGTQSHVLAALGLSDSEISGSLRISLGPLNTLDQVPLIATALKDALAEEFIRMHRHV